MSTPAAAHFDDGTRRIPPVAEIAVAGMVLVIVSTIYMAAKVYREVTMAIPWVLTVVGLVLVLVSAGVMLRTPHFPRHVFLRVAPWVLLGYGSIAGMLVYVFIRDGMRGERLAVMVLGLVVFAIAVTVLLGFSVARYQPSED